MEFILSTGGRGFSVSPSGCRVILVIWGRFAHEREYYKFGMCPMPPTAAARRHSRLRDQTLRQLQENGGQHPSGGNAASSQRGRQHASARGGARKRSTYFSTNVEFGFRQCPSWPAAGGHFRHSR